MAKKEKVNTQQPTMLDNVLSAIIETKQEDVKLHFITRKLRDGMTKRGKSLNKYLFQTYQIDVDDEIRNHLYDLSIKELESTLAKKYTLVDYNPISDDTDNLFSYQLKVETSSFSDVVINQLGKELQKVESIDGIVSETEELWAYSIGFQHLQTKSWIYTFRKIMISKIAIDEKDDSSKNIVLRHIRTLFDTRSKKLTLMKGEAVTLDKQIDCIYYDETFFVLKKVPFEQILGLQEEYRTQAIGLVDEMKSTGLFSGLENIGDDLQNNTSLHRKLVKLKQVGGMNGLDKNRIVTMSKVCKQYGDRINVNDAGLIQINNKNDFETVIKAMCDYYKKGEISGRSYGTFSGRELNPSEKQ